MIAISIQLHIHSIDVKVAYICCFKDYKGQTKINNNYHFISRVASSTSTHFHDSNRSDYFLFTRVPSEEVTAKIFLHVRPHLHFK